MGPCFKALSWLDEEARSIIYDRVCQKIMELSDASCDSSSEGREDSEGSQMTGDRREIGER